MAQVSGRRANLLNLIQGQESSAERHTTSPALTERVAEGTAYAVPALGSLGWPVQG
jgi:hypothetical protein